MDPETFALRKKFLEEFFSGKVKLINNKITISQDSFIDFSLMDHTEGLSFKTCVKFVDINDLYIDDLNIDIKEVYKLIKPFNYYLFSVTYKKKFLREKPLFTERIIINYKFHVDNVTTNVNTDIITDHYNYESLVNFSFLEYYNEKELSESHAVYSVNNAHLYYL